MCQRGEKKRGEDMSTYFRALGRKEKAAARGGCGFPAIYTNLLRKRKEKEKENVDSRAPWFKERG